MIDEYKKAFEVNENSSHVVPTCQTGCVNCGVCKNFGVRKILAKPYKASEKAQDISKQKREIENIPQSEIKQTFRYRIKLTKTGILKYFSHLDWQNTFFKAISRTNLKIAYSYGFNPTMKISMGVALPLFCESLSEFVDIQLLEDLPIEIVKSEIQKVLPKGSEILNVEKIDKNVPSIDSQASWAEYKIKIFNNGVYEFEDFVYNTNRVLSSDEIFIEKKNKKGLVKKVNIKKSIGSYRFENDYLLIVLKTGHNSEIPALRADVLMNIIAPEVIFEITRTKFLTENLKQM